MLARATAGLEALVAQPNVDRRKLAAIGFCQGGIVAAELARAGAPILCAIGFHPGLTRPAGSLDQPITAKVLMMVGNDDPMVLPEHRSAFMGVLTASPTRHIDRGTASLCSPVVAASTAPSPQKRVDTSRSRRRDDYRRLRTSVTVGRDNARVTSMRPRHCGCYVCGRAASSACSSYRC